MLICNDCGIIKSLVDFTLVLKRSRSDSNCLSCASFVTTVQIQDLEREKRCKLHMRPHLPRFYHDNTLLYCILPF